MCAWAVRMQWVAKQRCKVVNGWGACAWVVHVHPWVVRARSVRVGPIRTAEHRVDEDDESEHGRDVGERGRRECECLEELAHRGPTAALCQA